MQATSTQETQTIVNGHTSQQWNELAAKFTDHNIYQTPEYEESREDAAKTEVSRVVVTRANGPVGIAQVRIKRIPLIGGGLAYLYRGPLWRTGSGDPDTLSDVLRELHRVFCVGQGLTLRVVPNAATETGSAEWASGLEAAGFRAEASEKLERTIMLDLRPTVDELRKRLAQKWRNCLNQSERNGLKITRSRKMEDWQYFEALYDAMLKEKQFATGVSIEAFRRLQQVLEDGSKMQVLLAWSDGVPVAGHVSSTLGDTCIYLFGASGDAARQTKAAYLLQWEALVHARASGARWYDLGGVDLVTNPGVYHFKSGLGGIETEFLSSYVASPNSARKYLVPLAEAAYRRCRGKVGAN